MRRLEAKVETLAWVVRYRSARQQHAEHLATQRAIAAGEANDASKKADADKAAAGEEWLRVADGEDRFDPILAELWCVEYGNRSARAWEAVNIKNLADASFAEASQLFHNAVSQADRAGTEHRTGQKHLQRKRDEIRLAEVEELRLARRCGT